MADDGTALRTAQASYRLEQERLDYRATVLLIEERNGRKTWLSNGTTASQTAIMERDRVAAVALFVDRHIPVQHEATVITSFGLGVMPWVEARRMDPSVTTANMLTRTTNGSLMSLGFGIRSTGWILDAQLMLPNYSRTGLNNGFFFPVTVSRRF